MKENTVDVASLLVISTDAGIVDLIQSSAEANHWTVGIDANAEDAIGRIHAGAIPDLLVLDVPADSSDGLQALRTLHRVCPALSLIVIGHAGDLECKQEAVCMGAREYLIRPLPSRQLEMAIRHNLSARFEEAETDIASDDVEPVGNDKYFIGIGPAMRRLRARVALLAEADFPVFIAGEPGSGRETVARLLHRLSIRSGFEFARINCAALPEELLEREIFGCEASGSPESQRTKRGKLELCNKGTIFLDEVTEMPLRLQQKLTQVLEERQFARNGSSDPIAVNIRIVAASSIAFSQAIADGRLLADLSHHLGAYELSIPALRERKEELPFLSRHFMHKLAKRYGLPLRDIEDNMNQSWQAYDWPGNLAELEQSMKRYLVAGEPECRNTRIASEAVDEIQKSAPAKLRNGISAASATHQSEGGIRRYKSLRSLLRSVKEEAERNAIASALEETGWNRKAAARLLKTSYRTVLYKIEQYQMNATNFSNSTNGHEANLSKVGLQEESRQKVSAADIPRIPVAD